MASAYKCDRCKKFFEGEPNGTVSIFAKDLNHSDYRGKQERNLQTCRGCSIMILETAGTVPDVDE